MFDVSFSELVVIAVVALVVIGPEKLPRVARTAGHLLGRLQRYVGDVKADINREMQLEELKKLQQQVTDKVRGAESAFHQQISEVEGTFTKTFGPPAEAATDGAASPAPTLSAPAAAAPLAPAAPAAVAAAAEDKGKP